MRRLVLIFTLVFTVVTSCSLDEESDTTSFYLEIVPIDSVEMPEQFVYGQTYEVTVTFTRPNPCYVFNDFVYEIEGQTRTVAVMTTVYTNLNCIPLVESTTASFELNVTGTETYIFKFFTGQNEEGVDQYYIVEVPVVDGRPLAEGK